MARGMLHKTFTRLLGATLCLLILFVRGAAARGGDDEVVRPGMKLPAFEVRLTNGATVSDSTLRGKPAVVVLFNTRCYDCRRDLPHVERCYQEFGDSVAFVCIARQDSAEAVGRFWTAQGLTLPVAPQADRSVFDRFARRTIPRIYVADASGTVSDVFAGKVSLRKLRRALRNRPAEAATTH